MGGQVMREKTEKFETLQQTNLRLQAQATLPPPNPESASDMEERSPGSA